MFMSQIVFYFLHSTSVFSFYIDVVLTLFIYLEKLLKYERNYLLIFLLQLSWYLTEMERLRQSVWYIVEYFHEPILCNAFLMNAFIPRVLHYIETNQVHIPNTNNRICLYMILHEPWQLIICHPSFHVLLNSTSMPMEQYHVIISHVLWCSIGYQDICMYFLETLQKCTVKPMT